MNVQTRPELEDGSNETAQKTLDVIIIGAGFAGVCMGIKLLEAGISDFVILEKTDGIGGTWYKNTYPGAACDVPSHFYCYSFAPNPGWSRVYSPQAEIQTYIEKCSDDFGVTPYIEFGIDVTEVKLDEKTALWTVILPNGQKRQARHVVLGSGGLNTPSIPEIKGIDAFNGPAFHTAQWQKDVDLTGKKVAVIGSAASAVQAVPEIAKIAEKVVMFQRTPNYIMPRNDRAYTDKEKQSFRNNPWKLRLQRWAIFLRFEMILTPLFKKKSRIRNLVTGKIRAYIRRTIKDPALQEKLIPDYELGCKRVLISDDFYPALNRENVIVNTDGIDCIEGDGIVDGTGVKIDADVIVFATGFDLQKQMVSINLKGEGGTSLRDVWAKDATAYNGAMVSGFPNVYFVTGPNTGVGSTSIVFMIEAQVKFIMQCIELAGKDKLLQPKTDIQAAQNVKTQLDLQETVWAGSCDSWYKDESGRIHTLYPHTARRFLRERSKLRLDDFKIDQKTEEQMG
ncbi:MAG: NAD(P)/FAD-dependent oxidoreductase [Sneathiella sp.]